MQWIDKGTVDFLGKLINISIQDRKHNMGFASDPLNRIEEIKQNIKRDIRTIRTLRKRNKEFLELEQNQKKAKDFLKDMNASSIRPIQQRPRAICSEHSKPSIHDEMPITYYDEHIESGQQ